MSDCTFHIGLTHTYEQVISLDEARDLFGRPDADADAEQILELINDRESWTQDFDRRMGDFLEAVNSELEIDADYEEFE